MVSGEGKQEAGRSGADAPSLCGPSGFDPSRWALLKADLTLLAFNPAGISSDMRRANVYCHQEDARKRLVSLVPKMLRHVEARLSALVPDDIWTHPTDFAPEWIDAANLLEDVRSVLRDSDGSPEGRDREDGRDAQHDSAGRSDSEGIAQTPDETPNV